jgi:hypothetical protein
MGNNWMLRGVGIVIAIAATLGFKFWDKSQAHDESKAQLVALCSTDVTCVTAVSTHFEACFDASYSMGGRRSSGSLNAEAMASCINQRAGQPLFVAH